MGFEKMNIPVWEILTLAISIIAFILMFKALKWIDKIFEKKR
jgi:hypothetical protein